MPRWDIYVLRPRVRAETSGSETVPHIGPYRWPYMKQDIARYVSQCDICSRVKAGHQKPAGWLQPLPPPDWKWDKVEMDFVTGFPKSPNGNDAIFVVIDRFSKIAHFLPVKETITASQLADLYIF